MGNKKLAVLSISGGLDSTCLLLRLLSEGYSVKCYSFDYGQKHVVELEKLRNNLGFLILKGFDIAFQVINLRDCFSDSQSSLHQGGGDIPEGHYQDENMKSTVVENRNVIFSSIIYGKALSLAKKHDTNVEIFLGIHKGDHCLPYDELVLTREGKKSINMLIPGVDEVLSFSEEEGLSYQKVSNLVCNGIREDIFEVKTKGGRSLRGTSNHKFFVCDRFGFHQHTGWKKKIVQKTLSDLKVGDFLITPYKLRDFKKVCKDNSLIDLLPFCDRNHWSLHYDENNIWFKENNKVKRFVSQKSFIKLLAWFITEGSLGNVTNKHSNSYRIGIPQSRSHNSEYCDEIIEVISDWGFNITECEHKRSKSSNFFFSGPTTFLFRECGNISFNKKIPDFLIGLDDSLLLETLIKGDGSFQEGKFCYTTNSFVLKEQICSIGLQLGYSIGVTEHNSGNGVYSISLGFSDKKKMNVIGKKGDCKICEIVSIEKCKPTEVWDITVENNHNFIAGLGSGLLVSNSIYPDCTPESRAACENAFTISNWDGDKVSYQAPFVNIDKAEVLKEGIYAMDSLNFSEEEKFNILKNTHSCYNPDKNGKACGKCGTCVERLEAFAKNNMKDPAEYQVGI